MDHRRVRAAAWAIASLIGLGAAVVAGGCGSSSATVPSVGTVHTSPAVPGAHTSPAAAPGALTPEAASAATGDIPDNQVFLIFRNHRAGYSMKYPEGWAQRGAGSLVTFQDRNNLIRVVVARGALPTASEARRQLARLQAQTPGARRGTASPLVLAGGRALRTGYTTRSAPSPVTGKRVTLMVDRYYLARGGKVAVVDLGTPHGVDNVDAYRLIIHSFRWS